jgi:hypothetical protein
MAPTKLICGAVGNWVMTNHPHILIKTYPRKIATNTIEAIPRRKITNFCIKTPLSLERECFANFRFEVLKPEPNSFVMRWDTLENEWLFFLGTDNTFGHNYLLF